MTSDPDPLVTVCSACLCASCLQGVFYCENHLTAGTVEKRVSELRALGREHVRFFEPSHSSAPSGE